MWRLVQWILVYRSHWDLTTFYALCPVLISCEDVTHSVTCLAYTWHSRMCFLIVNGLITILFPSVLNVFFSNHMSWCLFKILKKSSQRSAHPFLGNCWQSQMEVSCTTSKWVNIFSKEQLRVPKIPLGGISSAWWEHSLKKLHLLVSSCLTFRLPRTFQNIICLFLVCLWLLRRL